VGGILVFTGIILLLIRYGLTKIIVGFFAVISFLVLVQFLDVVFSPLFFEISDLFSLLPFIVAIFMMVYYFKYAGLPFRNFTNIIIFLTIASIVSFALGVVPSLILIGIIAVYDYIAVFVTKHMITLAKGLGNGVFLGGLIFAAKKALRGRIMLGGGDVVFPAVLIDALYLNYPPIAAVLSIIGAVVGLSVLLFFGKHGKAYPAMTFIGPAQIGFFGIYLLTTII
jgi:presenilin-like A22 family membrane protease